MSPALALPVTRHKEWLHMDTVELEKLQWTQDLPPLRQQQTQEVRRGSWPTGVRGVGLSGALALAPRTQALPFPCA